MISHRVIARTIAGWRGLSAQVTRTITKILNKVDTRLRQRLPQRELEQIVQRALAARYPEAYYRLRSDHRPTTGLALPYNVSVVDVGPARDSLWRCAYDKCIDNLCTSRSITLAVVTKPDPQEDPRRAWRGGNESLKVLNPDECTDLSSDSEEESLSDLWSNGQPAKQLTGRRLALIAALEDQFFNQLESTSDSIDECEASASLNRLITGLVNETIAQSPSLEDRSFNQLESSSSSIPELEAPASLDLSSCLISENAQPTNPKLSVYIPVARPGDQPHRRGDEVFHLPVLNPNQQESKCSLISPSLHLNSSPRDVCICPCTNTHSDAMPRPTLPSPVRVTNDRTTTTTSSAPTKERRGPTPFLLSGREPNREQHLPSPSTNRGLHPPHPPLKATKEATAIVPPRPKSALKAPRIPGSAQKVKKVTWSSLKVHFAEDVGGLTDEVRSVAAEKRPDGGYAVAAVQRPDDQGQPGQAEIMSNEQRYFSEVSQSDLDLCLSAGNAARHDRYVRRGFF